MLKPIGHQDRLSVRRFDQILKSIKFPIMNDPHLTVLVVAGAICHLQELIRKPHRRSSINITVIHGKDQVTFKLLIFHSLRFAHLHFHIRYDEIRHLQIILRFHGYTYVADPVIDLFFCTDFGFVGKDNHLISLIWHKESLPVSCNKPSKPLTLVNESDLCPQIHKVSRCPCKSHDSLYLAADFSQRFESLALVRLETRQLIHDHHIKVEIPVLYKPCYILSVDDIHKRRLHKCGSSLFLGSHDNRVRDSLKVLPFPDLLRPCRRRHTLRCNNEYPSHLKLIEEQIPKCRERDHCLAKAHVQHQAARRMGQDKIRCKLLIIMSVVFHVTPPRSALLHQCKIPKTQVILTSLFSFSEAAASSFQGL